MKIAIPADDKNIDSTVCQSFGRTPYFLTYDTGTETVEFIDNSAASSQSAACSPLMPIFFRALLSIFLLTENAALTTRKKSLSSAISTGGTNLRLQAMTADSTEGGGINDVGGTMKAISGSV